MPFDDALFTKSKGTIENEFLFFLGACQGSRGPESWFFFGLAKHTNKQINKEDQVHNK